VLDRFAQGVVLHTQFFRYFTAGASLVQKLLRVSRDLGGQDRAAPASTGAIEAFGAFFPKLLDAADDTLFRNAEDADDLGLGTRPQAAKLGGEHAKRFAIVGRMLEDRL